MKEQSKLRRQIEVAEKKKDSRWLPMDLRLEAGRAAVRLNLNQGLSYKKFAKEVGVSPTTLANWIALARGKRPAKRGSKASSRKRKAAAGKIRPVLIQESQPVIGGLSLRLSSGISLSGLSVDEVAALHKALS